jgi:hypothetical protein
MGESLTQQHRVEDEASRCVNSCQQGINLTVPAEEAPANYVPAAAVRRRVQALSGIIGRKEFVGGCLSLVLNTGAQLRHGIGYWATRVR